MKYLILAAVAVVIIGIIYFVYIIGLACKAMDEYFNETYEDL